MVGRLQWIYQRHGWRAHSFGSSTIQDSCDIGGVFGSVVASNEGVIIQGDVYIYIASSSALIITYHKYSNPTNEKNEVVAVNPQLVFEACFNFYMLICVVAQQQNHVG